MSLPVENLCGEPMGADAHHVDTDQNSVENQMPSRGGMQLFPHFAILLAKHEGPEQGVRAARASVQLHRCRDPVRRGPR